MGTLSRTLALAALLLSPTALASEISDGGPAETLRWLAGCVAAWINLRPCEGGPPGEGTFMTEARVPVLA